MADFNGTPLDELQWREPEAIKFHNGITAENVHLYFMYSPFCDATSNNKVLELQARYNLDLYPILASRADFEARLRGMSGLEYMMVDGPQRTDPAMNPVWVIRKQRRVKEKGSEDRITVLGTFFAVGENIYQAPAVDDVLSCRLLSVMNNLTKVYKMAASMQYFSPSQGYSYHPPLSKNAPAPNRGLESVRSTSRAASPMLSDAPSASQQLSSTGQMTAASKSSGNSINARDAGALLESFRLATRYGTEYMDENPLVGEPGSFVFSSTQGHIQAQQAAAKAQAAAAVAAASAAATTSTSTKVGQEGKSTSVSAAPTPPGEIKFQKKATRVDKEKSPISPIGPGGKLKRRKSRAPGSPDGDV